MELTRDVRSVAEVNLALATTNATASIRWAWETFGERCCVLTSLQDAVLVDLVQAAAPEIPIVFLDNGFQFAATLETRDRVEERYSIKLEIVRPEPPKFPLLVEPNCCSMKVPLLEAALRDRDAWITGIQRVSTKNRATARLVDVDRRGKTKVSPLAQWNDADRAAYIDAFDVITHPLLDQGYSSIGCEPCTSPSSDGRSGRWADSKQNECGLHL